MASVDIKQADVDSLATKLASFKATLSQSEQNALAAMVSQAVGPDVAGFSSGTITWNTGGINWGTILTTTSTHH